MKQRILQTALARTIFRRQEGISLAEFALILPVFLLIVLGMADMGKGFNTYIGMLNATREGTFWLARNPDDLDGMYARIESELGQMGLTSAEMNISLDPDKTAYDPGELFTLTIEYPHELLFGAITGIPTLTLHTENTMRVQEE